jgi:hypothetical protein
MHDAVCSDKAATQIGSLSAGWLQNRLGLRINDHSSSPGSVSKEYSNYLSYLSRYSRSIE